jgi:hypothetical protein
MMRTQGRPAKTVKNREKSVSAYPSNLQESAKTCSKKREKYRQKSV